MKELTLTEIREIQIELLKKFHEICTQNQLCYSMCGGTLLGAVRHKGYIPWDDDIDVMMPREDYMKFIVIMQKYPNNDYGICSPYQKNKDAKKPYVQTFTKFVDKRTKLIGSASTRKIESNVYIDIFPIDGLPDSFEDCVKLYKKAKLLIKLNAIQKLLPYRMRNDKSRLLRFIWTGGYYLSRILPSNFFFDQLDKLAQNRKVAESEYVGDIVAGYGIKERVPKAIFAHLQLLPFEQEQFYAVKDYDTYLKALYGDYMQLPPKEKQISDHDDIAYLIVSDN